MDNESAVIMDEDGHDAQDAPLMSPEPINFDTAREQECAAFSQWHDYSMELLRTAGSAFDRDTPLALESREKLGGLLQTWESAFRGALIALFTEYPDCKTHRMYTDCFEYHLEIVQAFLPECGCKIPRTLLYFRGILRECREAAAEATMGAQIPVGALGQECWAEYFDSDFYRKGGRPDADWPGNKDPVLQALREELRLALARQGAA